ncbi:MAG: histidine kinase, partial [Thermodesulfobacterium geofontis]
MSVLCCDIANKDKPIKDFIIKDVITILPDSTLKEVLEKFIDHKIRHLPIVKDQRVVGVVSVKDVLKLI